MFFNHFLTLIIEFIYFILPVLTIIRCGLLFVNRYIIFVLYKCFLIV